MPEGNIEVRRRVYEALQRDDMSSIRSTFPDWDPSIVAVQEFGDRVVIHARGSGSGAASGVDIEVDFWQVGEFRDGRMVWYRAVRSEEEALAAAQQPR